ncbi:MAG TPA: DUF4340 domain-containing protein [Kiritimatiellia bacterium]|nr:DUF4340 domain-containing protein [Kiritimatiellia bacterium]HRZ11868.1 DUF4340 domain-containing protein [Kiritimatiellia bacterium]HSA17326.1 DUF4340 domain-containing protein [Kiritimatiellia bacterium]
MKFKTTWMLLLAVLLVGALMWRFERGTRSSRERAEAARRALDYEPADIVFLGLESTNLMVECVKEGGRWMITRPFRARADAGTVEHFLQGLRGLARGEVITRRDQKGRGLTPEQYGLSESAPRLVLGTPHHRRAVRIGRVAPLGGSVYIREEGQDEIVAVDQALLALLPASATDLRDRALLPGGPELVQRLEIRRGDGFLQIARGERGRWMIQQPVTARASSGEVQRFLEALFLLRAAEFLPAEMKDPAAYGFDDPGLRVSVTLSRGGEASVLVGDPVDRSAARFYTLSRPDDSAGMVEAAQLEPLNVTLDDLRDRKLTTMEARDVHRVVIEAGEQRVALREEAQGWSLVEPRRWNADPERMQELLSVWTAPVIQKFLPSPDAAAPAPDAEIVIRMGRRADPAGAAGGDAEEETVLEIGPASATAGCRSVRVRPDGFAAEIPESLLQFVSADPLFYRDRGVLRINPDEVARLAVSRDGWTEEIRRGSSGEFESGPGGEGTRVEVEAVKDLLRLLHDLRAERFLAETGAPADRYGFGPGADKLEIGLRGAAGLGNTLYFGQEAGPSGRYAMIQGQEGIFELNREDCERLLPRLLSTVPVSGSAENGAHAADAAGSPAVP